MSDPAEDDASLEESSTGSRPQADDSVDGSQPVRVVVDDGETETELTVEQGRVLRDVLLEADLSPYSRLTARANCGGRGLCATCGVRIAEDVEPDHWHDTLADWFGYPRLSCQIAVDRDLRVELVDKVVWGSRRPE